MRVLVVEDNALLRHHLKVQLQEMGHQVDDAEDAKEADYYLNEHLPEVWSRSHPRQRSGLQPCPASLHGQLAPAPAGKRHGYASGG